MRQTICILLSICLAACGADQASNAVGTADKPMRIVSLDYCADQFVLKLADREQILAISPDGVKDFSYMRDEAVGVPTVRPLAENILILKPDLVVRSYGGGPRAARFFERAGIPVINLPWTTNIDREEDGSIPSLIRHVADGMGQSERGDALVDEFRNRIETIGEPNKDKAALYLPSSGFTSGPGSLIHDMLVLAGYDNFESEPGWHSVNLEELVYDSPDMVAAAAFGARAYLPDTWSPMQHPVIERQLETRPVVRLDGAVTACSGWFLADAIEALAEGAEQ